MSQPTIDDIRDLTKTEVITLLNKHHQCALIRGTGFGKTWTCTEIAHNYGKVLFLYPADIIMNTAKEVMGSIIEEELDLDDDEVKEIIESKIAENVTFMSYCKFARLSIDEITNLAKNYDLIVADECHRLGGPKTKQNYRILIDVIKKNKFSTHRLITTATPFRTNEDFDVIAEFAGGVTPFAFTISDMIKNGFMKCPIYACGIYSDHFTNKKLDRGLMTSFMLEHHKIFNPPEKIKYVNEKYLDAEQLDSMLFICFYANSIQLHDLKDEVGSWFHEAHPDHHIHNIIVSSEKREYHKNVHKLLKLKRKHNSIILIHAIDMLNLGYHIKDITGVVMLRNTDSHIIYTQQAGRVYDTILSTKNRIIYDFMDNLYRRAIYDSDFEDAYVGRMGRIDFAVIDDLKSQKDSGAITLEEYNNRITAYLETIEVPQHGNTSKGLQNFLDVGSTNRNVLSYDMDIEFADAREQLRKLVTEPESILIRQTLIEFFRRWCISNDIEFPLTQKELEVLYEVRWSDFMKDLKQTLDKYGDKLLGVNNRYDATLYKYFVAMNEDNNTILKLDLFAKHIGQTTVPRIMELLEAAA